VRGRTPAAQLAAVRQNQRTPLNSQTTRQIVVLDAPSNLGLMPPSPGSEPGVRRLPDALREHGLISRIGAIDAGRVIPPAYDSAANPRSGVRNSEKIVSYSQALAVRVAELLQSDHFPLIIGGDCSILLGPLLALRRMGRFGLCFIDGHLDLLTPETSQSKGAAGMDLALALGYGPAVLANLEDLGPLVQETDVVVLGYRGDIRGYGALTRTESRPKLHWLPLGEIRTLGVSRAAHEALPRLLKSPLAGFWTHLDVDVLDDEVMPAVDSRQPDGMSYAELSELLLEIVNLPSAVGMEITILDPDLDPDGSVVEKFLTFIADIFPKSAHAGYGSA